MIEVVKSGNDIILYGKASVELLDRQGDYVASEAIENFAKKLFILKPEYRNLMEGHSNYKAGEILES